MLGAIVNVLRDGLNPHFFNYPSFFIYLAALTHFVAGGFFPPAGDSAWAISHDILLHTRLVSAFLGALTVPVVFVLGREIGGWKIGVLAALLLCFAPAHVQHSHFATVDVAATFWIALSLWLATRAVNSQRSEPQNGRPIARFLLLSALCAGLGAATKYNAVFVLAAPLGALFAIEYSMRARLASGIVATAIAGFLVGCPFSVLSFREFWGDGKNVGVAYELLVHPNQGSGDIFTDTGNGWLYHATFNLPFALTAPVAVAALGGIWLVSSGVIKARKNGIGNFRVLIPILAFVLCYFFALGFSQVRFLRYTLPLLPALTVFAALFVRAGVAALRSDNMVWKVAVAVSFLLISVIGTSNVLWPLTQPDPRDQAKIWMDSQNDATPISVGLADKENPLWFYTPPFWPQDAPPGSPFGWDKVQKTPRYDLLALGIDASALARTLGRTRPRYFVWSEFQWRERAMSSHR